VGFLSSGVIWACLNAVGNVPVWKEVFVIWVSAGTTEDEMAWRRIGSSEQVVGWLEKMSLETFAWQQREGQESVCVFAVKVFCKLVVWK